MPEKVTTMKLKVDLQREECYKKVKKLLCKFHQIRDQEYDEKQNMVTITVICCSPEKIRDKLLCKGCPCITSIEIVAPKQPGPEPPPQPPEKKPPQTKPKPPQTKPEPNPPPPVSVAVSMRVCCVSCHERRPGGSCTCDHPGRPPPCYDGYCGRPGYCSCGGGTCYVSRCDQDFCYENTSGCTIM